MALKQPERKQLADAADAGIIRSMICHENDLVNHRIQWLVTLEGLLFAALSVAWDKLPEFTYVLSGMGILAALSSGFSLHAARVAIHRLCHWWEDNKTADYHGPDVVGYISTSWMSRVASWHSLPWLFLAGWLALIGLRITQVC